MKKFIKLCPVLLLVLLTACTDVSRIIYTDSTDTVNTTETTKAVTTAEEVTADIPNIQYKEFSEKIEAEDGSSEGNISIDKTRKNYSGKGYITGFDENPQNVFYVEITVPTSQHYNITVCVASDEKKNNILTLDGDTVGEIISSGDSKFENISFINVYIEKGTHKLGISEVTGGIDVDYFYIVQSDDVNNISFTAENTLINKNANAKTIATMEFLSSNYGKNIISGQYATPGTNIELDTIYSITGHYPAIRLGDMLSYTSEVATESDEIEKSIEWSNRGGLVSYVWHWESPIDKPGYYTEDTDFHLKDAVTSEDIALLDIEEIEKLYNDGIISKECFELVKDIDTVSEQLKILRDNNVTVLWRPLHEASGEWFWWGADGIRSYLWLWDLLYTRQTEYHNLNNLIWVWNAQNSEWYVGDDKCDIISADIYVDKDCDESQINTFVQMQKISDKKMIALSECAAPPSADNMIRDRAMWSWFGVWSGEYIYDMFGEYNDTYISKEDLIKIYSHENVITLEGLPDLRN